MTALETIKQHLHPGSVYRRADLEKWSNSVDRHLQQLQNEGLLIKLSRGLYYCPKTTVFGVVPADDVVLVRAFLKNDSFLLTSPNFYNVLNLGTTQLYNKTIVYNHKRHGRIKLGKREFQFAKKTDFPTHLTPEFLLVDIVNDIDQLAEDKEQVLTQVKVKARSMDRQMLTKAVRDYGGVKAKKFFARTLADNSVGYFH